MGECSLYETATQEVITMYNDEFNNNDMYRFTNREVPRDDYAPAPRQESTYTAPVKKQGFFHRTWVKVTALVLACAVVGGAAGYGGAALAKGGSGSGTAIKESDRTVTAVEVKKVDGKTKMQPAEVYASTVNSTVSINCSSQSTNIFGQTTQSASSGSGFIISQDGYIVTNYHVINGASSVKVTLYNGDTYDATVIGGDSDYDVAVIKIDATGLSPVTLGNSEDVNVGDTVLAIGNPLGELTFSLTAGLVSAKDREVTLSNSLTMDLIQTDCAINSGNSGGALFNLYGEVIGITNAKYSSSSSSSTASIDNIGFAIPINHVLSIVKSIIEKGYLSKPYVGVSVSDVNQQTQLYGIPAGAAVQAVSDDSPAAKAGLQAGDVITRVNGTEITGSSDLVNLVSEAAIGDTLTMTVYRQGSTIELTVTVGEQVQSALANEQTQQAASDSQSGGWNGYPFGGRR